MNKIEKLIKQCKIHLTRYEYPEVEEYCDKILEIKPDSWWGLKYKGISLYQREKYEKAIPVYEKHYNLYPDDRDTKITLIEMYEKQKTYDKALELYQEESKSDETKYKEKSLMSKMKKYPEIIQKYNNKLKQADNRKQSPDNIKFKIILLEERGVFQYRNHQYEEAYNSYRQASQLYPKVANHLIYKEDFDPWYEMLDKLLAQHDDSKQFFQEFFNREENTNIWCDKLTHKLSQYEDPLVFADIMLEKNSDNTKILESIAKAVFYVDPKYSLKCWKKVLEIEPENTEAINKILDIYSRQYSKDRSLKLINSKLYIREIKPELLVKKIRILESVTLYDEALETYDEYLSLDLPEGLIYHDLTIFDKIRCLEQKALDQYYDNNFNESYKTYMEAFEIFKNTKKNSSVIPSEEWTMEDWYNRILGESIRNSDDNPEKFFNEFFQINKKSLPLWLEKIEFLIPWNRLGNPVSYCNILMSRNYANDKILLAKANVYYRTKRLQKALELYDEVLKHDGNNNTANIRKFNLLVQLEEYQKAYRILKNIPDISQEINRELNTLAEYLLKRRKYDESKYCYERLLNESYLSYQSINKLKYIWDKTNDQQSQKQSPYYLDWINLINYRHTEYKCPECGGKLVPILYGLPVNDVMDEADKGEVVLGGCCVSNDSPTDYCSNCEKEINMGTYGIDITLDDYGLFTFTQQKIEWLTSTLEESPKKTIKQLEKEAFRVFSLDKIEFYAFIEKLEKIGHINVEKNHLKLNMEYKKFHNVL